MPPKLIRYRVKPEKIEENQRLIEDVFRELHTKSPKDARYLVLKLSDGTSAICSRTPRRLFRTSTPSRRFGAAAKSGASMSRNSWRRRSSATTVCSPTAELEPYGSHCRTGRNAA
jgi:hypothetical protein